MEEKKRSTKKFNIVDIIIVVILLIGAAFLGMKLLGGDEGSVGSSARVRYSVMVFDVNRQVADNVLAIQEGGEKIQLMANGALVDGWVDGVQITPHVTHEAGADGVVVAASEQGDEANVDMVFDIEAAVDSLTTKKVGTQEVRVGKGHIVKTTEYEMEGYDAVILSLEVVE